MMKPAKSKSKKIDRELPNAERKRKPDQELANAKRERNKAKPVAKKTVKLTRAERKALAQKRKKNEAAQMRNAKRDMENMGFWERRSYKKKLKRDLEIRRRAEDLASLPKHPVLRFFAHLSPRRVFRYWFSLRGLKTFAKFCFACLLLGIIFLGGLFLYFKKEVAGVKLNNLVISETVNKYYDRNGELLWEDTGTDNYRLTIEPDEVSDYIRYATISIEDKNFYNHPGVDFKGLLRAVISTLSGASVQGGSTITQQLIKQVYFADEAASANRGGIPRKIKELILAVELEKMYEKDQILTMYLNESPYGGRRNGVESAAQTYFNKTTKDLSIAEAALLASIPNNPAVLNPYNENADPGHVALLARQQKTIDRMVEYGYITKEEGEEAKAYDIISTIQPEASQYENIKAPHFVLTVKSLLEEKYGRHTLGSGGFTITTSLDMRAQRAAEEAVANGASLFYTNNSDNLALASVDVETSQVIAMVGSIDFNNPEYGTFNAATALIEPGSTIKPVLDYAPLFMERSGQNFGPGTILRDENIDAIYCRGAFSGCMLRNYTRVFYGNLAIRESLANSLNIPAVKALYINGIENSLDVLHRLGDVSYCADNAAAAGLSIAIGSGCNIRLVEHANTYASIARGGSYKDLVYVLEVKNSSGDVLESWSDKAGTRVVDEQVAYMIWSILHDAQARLRLFGSMSYSFGFNIPGVETASKTGTTTTANSSETKDSLMVSFSKAVVAVVWNGRHDGSGLSDSSNTVVRRVINDYMGAVHYNMYAPDHRWAEGDVIAQPAGIQTLTVNGKTDIWPSWYSNKTSGVSNEKLDFNRYTKKLASSCTPAKDIISVEATKYIDPMTKAEIWNVPEGYDRDTKDDCSYTPPAVSISRSGNYISINVSGSNVIGGSYTLSGSSGTLNSATIKSASFLDTHKITGKEGSIVVTIVDTKGVSASSSALSIPVPTTSSSSSSDKSSDTSSDKKKETEASNDFD